MTEISQDALRVNLLPCPFCGGVPWIDEGSSVYGRFWWSVWCEECGISVHDREVWTEGANLHPDYPPKECFARWNRRAALPQGRTFDSLQKALQEAYGRLREYGEVI